MQEHILIEIDTTNIEETLVMNICFGNERQIIK